MAEENKNYFTRLMVLAKNKQVKDQNGDKSNPVIDLSSVMMDDDSYINSLLLEAERLIDQIDVGAITFGRLRQRDLNLLSLYFYLSNPVFNRIVNLHVTLPLSSLTLQKPKTDNSLVQDYVYSYFERFLDSCNWKRWLYLVTLYYFLFGEGLLLCEDDFPNEKNVDVDEDVILKDAQMLTPETREKIDAITKKYDVDGETGVTLKELQFVIKHFMRNYNPDYKGLLRMRVLNPFKIDAIEENQEVDLKVYYYPQSPYIKKYISESGGFLTHSKEVPANVYKDLESVGYSKPFIDLNLLNTDNSGFVQITNDPFDDVGVYVAEMKVQDVCGSLASMVSPVLKDLLRYHHASLALDMRLKLSSKKVILISADPSTSEVQLGELESKISSAIEEPEGALVSVNYSVSVEEVRFDIKEDLNVDDIREAARQGISLGTGTPDALLSGDETYGSSFLKLEVLNMEFLSFRNSLKDFFSKNILEAVALKRGFVTTDIFGKIKPIYPQVNFEVGSIIGQTEFKDVLRDMAGQQQFPMSKLLEYYGFDSEEIFQQLKKDQELLQDMGLIPSPEQQGIPPEQEGYPDQQNEYTEDNQENLEPVVEIDQEKQQSEKAPKQEVQESGQVQEEVEQDPYQLEQKTRTVSKLRGHNSREYKKFMMKVRSSNLSKKKTNKNREKRQNES